MLSPKELAQLEKSDFKEAAHDLIEITHTTLRLRAALLFITLLNLLDLLIYFVIHMNLNGRTALYLTIERATELKMFERAAAVVGFFLVANGIGLIYMFWERRQRGMVIYEELTEQIDWNSKRKEYIYKPPVFTRLIIREFLRSTDFPFISGANGRLFYLFINGLFIIAFILGCIN